MEPKRESTLDTRECDIYRELGAQGKATHRNIFSSLFFSPPILSLTSPLCRRALLPTRVEQGEAQVIVMVKNVDHSHGVELGAEPHDLVEDAKHVLEGYQKKVHV